MRLYINQHVSEHIINTNLYYFFVILFQSTSSVSFLYIKNNGVFFPQSFFLSDILSLKKPLEFKIS